MFHKESDLDTFIAMTTTLIECMVIIILYRSVAHYRNATRKTRSYTLPGISEHYEDI